MRARAGLLALDPAAGVAALAGAQAAADALAVLARLRGLEVGEGELRCLLVGHGYASSTLTRWSTFLSIPASCGLSFCSTACPIRPQAERAQRAAMALGLADLAADLGDLDLAHRLGSSRGVSARRLGLGGLGSRLGAAPRRRLRGCLGDGVRDCGLRLGLGLGLLLGGLRLRHRQHLRDASARACARPPRGGAAAAGRRRWPSSMLIGFVVPRLFARMSWIPPSSSTARTPPPAMTPVPSLAGRSSTRAAPNSPRISCVIVCAVLRHREEVLLRVVDGLRDRERNLARLPVADADAVDLVADHDERGEREPPAALDHLGDAVDLDHALLELSALCDVDSHLELQSSLARAVGERLDAAVVQVAAAVEDDGLDARPSSPFAASELADLGRLLGLRCP